MAALSWVGTIASVLGLLAAVWAAVKAQGAARAAEAARDSLRLLQAPWLLQELEEMVRVLQTAVHAEEWNAARMVADYGFGRSSGLMGYFGDQLSAKDLTLLKSVPGRLRSVSNVAVRMSRPEPASNPSIERAVAKDELDTAQADLLTVIDALRNRGESPG